MYRSLSDYLVSMFLHSPGVAPSGGRSSGALDALAKGSALAAVGVWVGASFG